MEQNPLVIAASNEHIDAVNYLINHRYISFYEENPKQINALQAAISNLHFFTARLLLNNGTASLNNENENEELLLIAIQTESLDIITLHDQMLEIPYSKIFQIIINIYYNLEIPKSLILIFPYFPFKMLINNP